MKIIGLTGGIASGKSTVSGMIRQMGIPVICADRLAHKVIEPGKPAYKKIVALFGQKVLFPDKGSPTQGSPTQGSPTRSSRNLPIHRARLASIIFSSPLKRKRLNSIVHPYVISEIKKEIKKLRVFNPRVVDPRVIDPKKKIIVLDIPLLFEEKLNKLCDEVVVVYAPERIMMERLKKRDRLSLKEIKNRLASQMPLSDKKKLATHIIDNSENLSKTLLNTIQIFNKYK